MENNNSKRRDFLCMAGIGAAAGLLHPMVALGRSTSSESKQGLRDAVISIQRFGVTGDGKTLDTPAINRAIEEVSRIGGGTLWFPSGTYACHSIHLKSNVSIYLDSGAVILAADSTGDSASNGYDMAESNQPWEKYQDFGHNHWHNSLIWGENIHDFCIFGPGLIWGKGLSKGRGAGPKAETPGVGNKAIALKNCRNVLLRDFSILEGGHFGILATGVDNLTIDNLKIDTNRDGMDIDCCRNTKIVNCTVNSPWDDAICLKSSYSLGRLANTENVTISNCIVSGSYELGAVLDGTLRKFPSGFAVARQGRIKLGTESNGGFRNIVISNCIIDGCKGIALETVDGSLLEDVAITNITMRDVTDTPIFLRLGSRLRGPEGTSIGSLKRVIISNVVSYNCIGRLPGMILGIPNHPVEDIQLSNLYLHHSGSASKDMASAVPPEEEGAYPEANRFGTMPAQGFFIRHARNIQMSNVDIAYDEDDARPAFVLNDVQDADFFRIRVRHSENIPAFSLENVHGLSILASRGIRDTQMAFVENGSL